MLQLVYWARKRPSDWVGFVFRLIGIALREHLRVEFLPVFPCIFFVRSSGSGSCRHVCCVVLQLVYLARKRPFDWVGFVFHLIGIALREHLRVEFLSVFPCIFFVRSSGSGSCRHVCGLVLHLAYWKKNWPSYWLFLFFHSTSGDSLIGVALKRLYASSIVCRIPMSSPIAWFLLL